MNATDKEHIERCRNGHPDDYRFLVERYQGAVFAYLATRLGDWGRIYAGAGPVLMYGVMDMDNEDIDTNAGTVTEYDDRDYALGLGVYARAGIEFTLNYRNTIGLGVRGVKADLDFNDTVGEVDIQGVQAMLTYGFRF